MTEFSAMTRLIRQRHAQRGPAHGTFLPEPAPKPRDDDEIRQALQRRGGGRGTWLADIQRNDGGDTP